MDCGACEPECPVEAIFPEDEVPDKWNDCTRYNYEGIWCFTTVKGDF
ncbi:ferredoxin family protein [candidate division KSB1 bacterium]|nr:ferredoxin family protein [candidate division KSB1 bacterium]